jgi:Ca-activated chloride channel homolog
MKAGRMVGAGALAAGLVVSAPAEAALTLLVAAGGGGASGVNEADSGGQIITSGSDGGFSGFGGAGGFGGGGGGGGGALDADYGALMQISHATGGTFYQARDASELSRALGKLPAAISVVRTQVDIAADFALAGGLLVAVAVALSLWWNRARSPVPRSGVTAG